MNKFALIIAATLGLSACVAPMDEPNGAVIIPVPVGVPVIIHDKTDMTNKKDTEKNSVHVCKIKAFTDTFTAEHESRGKARLAAKKKCTAAHHEMFCRDDDIECTEYK
ncbi:hypothetical protein [Moraxella canis]|uniref:Lipoprotein n=1 Tax=Moraxella canis TaxID=90239 RepID=A0A1S9ZFV2_9GAMM|nr:hypothetical protein [Moraxella canis]OOR82399.1 hypothetical protein B0180_09415 [Moraxella canis]